MNIPFNIPYFSGRESVYLNDYFTNSGRSDYLPYYEKCRKAICEKWNYPEVYLTTSCTTALEISAIITGIKSGDEVIVPSYTFPSTANAFIRQGARIICADSGKDHPGIDEDQIESLITENTKAIILVHYAGVACDMDKILRTAQKYNLLVIEYAAHSLGSYYKGKPLGGLGNIGCFSFHRTKNIQCEEGGAILINDKEYSERISFILEKGTNRKEFIEGKTGHYEWVDIGSSYSLSEMHAAFLFSQLELSDIITENRKNLWKSYYEMLIPLEHQGLIRLPHIHEYCDHNAHIFYLVLKSKTSGIN